MKSNSIDSETEFDVAAHSWILTKCKDTLDGFPPRSHISITTDEDITICVYKDKNSHQWWQWRSKSSKLSKPQRII